MVGGCKKYLPTWRIGLRDQYELIKKIWEKSLSGVCTQAEKGYLQFKASSKGMV